MRLKSALPDNVCQLNVVSVTVTPEADYIFINSISQNIEVDRDFEVPH
jgi:hypothetical protein